MLQEIREDHEEVCIKSLGIAHSHLQLLIKNFSILECEVFLLLVLEWDLCQEM